MVPSPLWPPLVGDLATTRFAVVDVETNGLRFGRNRVLQVAVVRTTADGGVVDRWVTDVRAPWGRVGPVEVHGITPARTRAAPRFAAVAAELVARLDGHVLVAHNAGFDWGFLRAELGRLGYATPSPLRLDTLRLSRSLDPEGLAPHGLADLAARYGVDGGRAHDALADAEATAAVLPKLLADAGVTTLEDLRPRLWGSDTRWPPLQRSRPRALRWQLHRLRPRRRSRQRRQRRQRR